MYSGRVTHCQSQESLDVQMLLDPFENQLNLPAFTVQFRNSERVFNCEVVEQEVIDFSDLKVFIYNKSQRVGILWGRAIAVNLIISSERTPEHLLTGLYSITS